MARERKRRKLPGHYCWACDCRRPNEAFSGKGHARHLCKDCARLGSVELTHRQNLRRLERCVTWDGMIRRRRRQEFERFLQHPDPRIRNLAQQIHDECRSLSAARNEFEFADEFEAVLRGDAELEKVNYVLNELADCMEELR